MKVNEISEKAFLGRILLSEAVSPHLEAFSKNALYYGRGIPTMNKYKTVKEVCALTGLTRKHLYYFHHEKVVQASAYANYSVEGNDGYKLYDDAAVEKLQQISLYYQLGLKRDEIRDIMLDPNYDSAVVIDTMLAIERTKKVRTDRHIAALEYLKASGHRKRIFSPLRGITLEEFGETIMILKESSQSDCSIAHMQKAQADSFSQEFLTHLLSLCQIDLNEMDAQAADETIQNLIETGTKYLGEDGIPFILGYFAYVLKSEELPSDPQDKISPEHARAIIRYFAKHPELYKQLSTDQD